MSSEEKKQQPSEIPQASNDLAVEKSAVQTNKSNENLVIAKGNLASLEPTEPHDDNFEVFWEDPAEHDPAHPMNWSKMRKAANICMISFLTFLTSVLAPPIKDLQAVLMLNRPLASSMFAPAVPQVMKDFKTSSNTLATIVVAIYVLGFAFGPLVVAPVSELRGRLLVYHSCNVLFCIFTMASALAKNMAMLVVFRFLAGVAGVAPVTIGSGTIADLVPRERRGMTIAFWSLGPIMGPVIGPIVGGFIAQSLGWRWVFWVLLIVSGVATAAAFLILSETYAPVILERKAARLRKTTGDARFVSKLVSSDAPRAVFKRSILRPLRMLLLSPVVTLLSIYIAVLYGLLYILFTTFTFVYEEIYNFSTSAAGLSFIGSGIGTLVGLAASATLSDFSIRKRTAAGQEPQPEDRLPTYLVLPASTAVPIGLFIYGWGADKHLHWIVPQIGNAVTGAGMIVIVMCVQTYLVDAFTLHAASAIAANTVLRSLLGALLPLGGLHLYDAIGLGWGNSLLGFIAFGMVPIPLLFRAYGGRIRGSRFGQVKF